MNKNWKYLLSITTLVAATVWVAVLFFPDKNFHLIACDVGQGDAILAYSGTNQILIDGGPSGQITKCLSKYLPFWDRKIEVVLMTHPQTDHYKGFIDIFKKFEVANFITTGLDSSSQEFKVLKDLVGGSRTKLTEVREGTKIRLGLMYLDIVWPMREFLTENLNKKLDDSEKNVLGSYTSKRDPNDFSIVAILSFGEFDALLTGDIGPEISNQLSVGQFVRDVEYIKVPHHGSKNGLSSQLLEVSSPEMAVISAGKNNSYGHPHKETLDLLTKYGAKILRTDLRGDIEISTDGESFQIEN